MNLDAESGTVVDRLARTPGHHAVLGAILRMPNETLLESLGATNYDFVVIDCEHGPGDILPLHHHVACASAAGLSVLVRVSGHDSTEVQRVLDLGVAGIVVPHVDSAAEASRIVQVAHYPPRGTRGMATYTRAGRFGTVNAESHAATSAKVLVICMVEDMQAAGVAASIAATDGVDGVLVGTADLAWDVRCNGASIAVAAMTAAIEDAARAEGRAVARLVSGRVQAQRAMDEGCELVVLNSQALLTSSLTDVRAAAVDGPASV